MFTILDGEERSADRFALVSALSTLKAMFDAYERIVQNTTLDDDDDFAKRKAKTSRFSRQRRR